MLTENTKTQSKWIRTLSYIVIAGFALLMFLPTSVSLPEILLGDFNSNYVEVEGKEIFHIRNAIVGKSIQEILQENIDQTDPQAAQSIIQILTNWQEPLLLPQLEIIRQEISRIILSELLIHFAEDNGYRLSQEDLTEFIQYSYTEHLKNLYKDYQKKHTNQTLSFTEWIDENADYYWQSFHNWAQYHLHNQYQHNIMARGLYTAIEAPLPEIRTAYITDKHKVQVDYAYYSYTDFIKSAFLEQAISEEALQAYAETQRELEVERATFSNKKDAQQAHRDPELFEKTTSTPSKYSSTSLKIPQQNALYAKLAKHALYEISPIMTGSPGEFHIYKILSKGSSFAEIQSDASAYQELHKRYARTHYKELEQAYTKHAKRLLRSFRSRTKQSSFESLTAEFPQLHIGRTDFFSHTSSTLQEDASDELKVFLDYNFLKDIHYTNEVFFKEAYTLKKGEISAKVLSNASDAQQPQRTFFILKKTDEKIPDLTQLLQEDTLQKYTRQVKMIALNIISRFWLDFLQNTQGYRVSFNTKKILKALNLDSKRTRQ